MNVPVEWKSTTGSIRSLRTPHHRHWVAAADKFPLIDRLLREVSDRGVVYALSIWRDVPVTLPESIIHNLYIYRRVLSTTPRRDSQVLPDIVQSLCWAILLASIDWPSFPVEAVEVENATIT